MVRPIASAVLIAATLLAAPSALAMTIGYVDTAHVLVSYKGAKSAQAQMQKQLMQYQNEFAKRQKKIAAAQKAGKSAAEIEKMTEKYEAELAPLKAKAQQLEESLSGSVKGKIESKITMIAKKRHVDLVLDKAAVLYGGVDLTNDVIQALK